jgi:hypothetical protein
MKSILFISLFTTVNCFSQTSKDSVVNIEDKFNIIFNEARKNYNNSWDEYCYWRDIKAVMDEVDALNKKYSKKYYLDLKLIKK